MLPVRIAFDPKLPVEVAWPTLQIGERQLKSGTRLDWQALGISELTLRELWRAGAVSFLPAESPPSPPIAKAPTPAPSPKQPRR